MPTNATAPINEASFSAAISANDLRLPPMPELGFTNYWYPVLFSSKLKRKPVAMRLLGEPVLFFRYEGKAYALRDQCPHRGAPLRLGFSIGPGLVTCGFHGFTFDVTNGKSVALLTEGPDSPAVGRICVRSYPVEERCGLVWIYMGQGKPPPIEEDIPEAMLEKDAVVVGTIATWKGHWRVMVDTGIDVTHAQVLHRNNIRVRFSMMPAFAKVKSRREGPWLDAVLEDVQYEADFPRVGRWPRDLRFRRFGPPVGIAVRLPGITRIIDLGRNYVHYRWATPIGNDVTLNVQVLVRRTRGLGALWFKLYYHLFEKWRYHVSFQDTDKLMAEHIDRFVPEYPTQSDSIIMQWRRMAKEMRQSA